MPDTSPPRSSSTPRVFGMASATPQVVEQRAELRSRLASDALTVGVIGQGIVGAMTARLASRAAARVIAYDRDPARVAAVGRESEGVPNWSVVDDVMALNSADVLVIAVRVPLRSDGTPDVSPLQRACSDVARLELRPRLLMLETTVPPGTTRRMFEPLVTSDDAALLVAHCPERLRVGDGEQEVLSVPRLVGGLTSAATSLACFYLTRVGYQVVPVSSPEVAELSKLLENAFLTTGISLMGEITRLAHALGVSAMEVASAAASKPNGYYSFWPGAGIGGHCLGNDLALLQGTARRLRISTPLLDGVADAAAAMTPSVLDYLRLLLRQQSLELKGAKIWIVGVGFKVGSSDTAATPAIDLVRGLRKQGADVVYSDKGVDDFSVDDTPVLRVTHEAWPQDVTAAVVLAGDPTLNLSTLSEHVVLILDLGGARIMSGSAPVHTL